jgi:hypothetical protein
MCTNNQTYLINQESKPFNLIELNKNKMRLQEDHVYLQRKEETKQRLSQMRERAKQMLKKHNWQRFFSNQMPNSHYDLPSANALSQQHTNFLSNTDDLSFVSAIEFSWQMLNKTTVDNKSNVCQTKSKYTIVFSLIFFSFNLKSSLNSNNKIENKSKI